MDETITRRRFVTGGALAAGGVATAAIALPALGFALGPIFEKTEHEGWQDQSADSALTRDHFGFNLECGPRWRALRAVP